MSKRLVTFVLCSITVIFYTCKKNQNTPNQNQNNNSSQIYSRDTIITPAEDSILASQPQLYDTDQTLILDNGQTIYDYLSATDPEKLSSILQKHSKSPSKSTTNIQTSQTNSIRDIVADMGAKAAYLNNHAFWAKTITSEGSNKPAQPNGLAYVWNSKSITKRLASSASQPGNCTIEYYGLDCSGYIYQIANNAGLIFPQDTYYLSVAYFIQVSHWNTAFATNSKVSYATISMTKFAIDQLKPSELKLGDIVYWSHSTSDDDAFHIGIVLLNSSGNLAIFMSGGGPDASCQDNSRFNHGPKEMPLTSIGWSPHWGILRMTTSQIMYAGSTPLPHEMTDIACTGLGQKLFFAGNDENNISKTPVDIYDTVAHSWSTLFLSTSRSKFGAAAAGTKVLFAGGEVSNDDGSDVVDIFDIGSDGKITPTISHLSQPRYLLAGASAGTKIMFAGGDHADSYVSTVDVYDVTNDGHWDTPIQLSAPRRKLAAASTGTAIMFAGGEDGTVDIETSKVDLYDFSGTSVQPSLGNLPSAVYDFNGAGAANKFAFNIGGINGLPAMYDLTSKAWVTLTNPYHHYYTVVSSAGNFLVFGGYGIVDVYNVVDNTWETITMKTNIQYTNAASTGKTIMFAGFPVGDNDQVPNTVDIFILLDK